MSNLLVFWWQGLSNFYISQGWLQIKENLKFMRMELLMLSNLAFVPYKMDWCWMLKVLGEEVKIRLQVVNTRQYYYAVNVQMIKGWFYFAVRYSYKL